MKVEYEKKGNEVIFKFIGDFIVSEIDKNKNEIRKIIEHNPKTVIFDLNDVEFIDSSGLGFIVAIYKHLRQNNCSFVVKNLNPKVKEIFQLTKIDKILKIE